MKKISKLFNNIKQTISNRFDPKFKSDSTSSFFHKVEVKDKPYNYSSQKYNNNMPIIEDRIKNLDRVILTGSSKTRVTARIEELILKSNLGYVSDEMKEICEIVHYGCVNDTPVRLHLIKKLVPDLNIEEFDIINEEQYDEWLKFKNNEEATDSTIDIEDTYGMNREKGRGKKSFDEWTINTGNKGSQWNKK